MKIEIREVYKCDYCNKLYQIKKACEAHEKRCSKNPLNERPCFNCHYLCKKKTTITNENCLGDEYEETLNMFFCDSFEKHVYPPIVEHKQNAIDGHFENDRMPIVCVNQKPFYQINIIYEN